MSKFVFGKILDKVLELCGYVGRAINYFKKLEDTADKQNKEKQSASDANKEIEDK